MFSVFIHIFRVYYVYPASCYKVVGPLQIEFYEAVQHVIISFACIPFFVVFFLFFLFNLFLSLNPLGSILSL